jgi:hypothetical protein
LYSNQQREMPITKTKFFFRIFDSIFSISIFITHHKISQPKRMLPFRLTWL